MRILSYNLNGIRSALSKGLVDWIRENPADIICFQETKAQEEQVDLGPLLEMGYHAHWYSAEKKGYSGVCTLSKTKPNQVMRGCCIEEYDREGRVLRTDFGDMTLLNCYFPSGTSGEERQAFKMKYLEDFTLWIEELRKERPRLIIAGDFNIAHTERDIHDPKGNKNSTGFLPEEREWMTRWFENGFVDTFRKIHPEKQEYSWWSFRFAARSNNKGWRIDYITISKELESRLVDAGHFNSAIHSDHCPVYLDLVN
jgi:exodeoxyribonuclease III